ncbi:NUDIX hydrolase [Ktedonobacteria bacterium brp13]|nr:NUDIX hydrolase [Ktedonobacteria bacterium brp13]
MVAQARMAAAVMLLRTLENEVEYVQQEAEQDQSGEQSRNFEVFMVRRASKSVFMPDVYVFPGGAVSVEDLTIEAQEDLCYPIELTVEDRGRTALGNGVRTAAIRELFEEANILLAYTTVAPIPKLLEIDTEALERFAGYRSALNTRQTKLSEPGTLEEMLRAERLVLAVDRLSYFAHWITPITQPKRYDTHFFLANAPLQQEALYDQLETSDGLWIEPAEALARNAAGSFPLAFPTIHQLRELASFPTIDAAFSVAREGVVSTIQPVQVEREGKTQFVLPVD